MRLFNTLTRQVEDFTPQDGNRVTMYSCGPTVYDYLHIGNWTAYLRWDILASALRASGHELHWIMNITDVGHLTSDADEGEDKLEKGARREGKSAWEVADYYTQDFMRGLRFLGIHMGENGKIVKATEHIAEQIDLIKTLEEKGYTYLTSDGVYFDTSKLDDYGKLARLDIAGLQAGARVATGEKKHLTDFAVWKFSPADKKRDMEWDSPWGKGFPGWHIECSAMAMKYLGETLDIHTGGIDHIPVHHTNEIAQSEAATGKPFSRFWIHSNFLLISDEKIAKSTGNGITLRNITAQGFDGQDIRMMVLQSHYRTEANFTWDVLAAAQARLNNWKSIASLRWQVQSTDEPAQIIEDAGSDMLAALQNDLNTPEALRAIDGAFAHAEQHGLNQATLQPFVNLLQQINLLLGINLFDEDITDNQKHTITVRQEARNQKDWKQSDELRDQLLEQGIAVRDTDNGPIWFRT